MATPAFYQWALLTWSRSAPEFLEWRTGCQPRPSPWQGAGFGRGGLLPSDEVPFRPLSFHYAQTICSCNSAASFGPAQSVAVTSRVMVTKAKVSSAVEMRACGVMSRKRQMSSTFTLE
jgi:hypothetical protein